MDVHVRDLRYFVAVAEELHFTQAAERLFVSQPALSKQIRLLEEHLRVALFDRDRRRVALTPAGEALLPAAHELIAAWDSAQRAVADAAATANAVLKIGFSTSIGRGLLPRIQRAFAQSRPAWRLELRQVDWSDPTCGLTDGSSDLAFAWLPVPDSDQYSQVVLAQEPRHVALPHHHAFAERSEIAFPALLDEPFLALPESAGPSRDYWLAIEQRREQPPRIGAIVNNADETFEALLAAGNAEIYHREGITTVPVTGIPSSQLALIWRTEDYRDAIHDFQRAAIESVPKPCDPNPPPGITRSPARPAAPKAQPPAAR